ncbi:putative mitochondrial protein [Vitis vinifera]|uniref:Putative mitochondrial protein n=1 Tax=Vitis vinifera TaxID=29760 RepID=A0A438DK60_VITVI|nr:putative mitochondrial protein [Vitis vinifera]
MGGLRPDISDGIRMFKPQTLKEAINLARMKDDQLARQRRFGGLALPTRAPLTLPPTQLATPPAPAAPVRTQMSGTMDTPVGRELTMEFMWENQTKKLVGIDRQHIQAASIKELTKEIRPSHAQFALCLQVAHTKPQNIHSSMREILQEFSDLFTEPSSLPPTREVDHSIALKEGTEPINVRPYRYAHYQKKEIEKQIQDMLQSGLVRPSTSPFSSPVLLVKKKDENWRFCTDYRALNAATIKDQFSIPTVDDMLDELYGASYFTKLDLRAGYHQTFEILRQHRFFVKASKCAFGQQELEYLGHIITRKGVKVDENKIAAMVAWPRPTNISELRGFLGLTGYYRKFVKDYGIIARPLTNLLKKGQFGWHGEAETAFLALK